MISYGGVMAFFNVWELGLIKISVLLAAFGLACTTGQVPASAPQMNPDAGVPPVAAPRLLVFLVIDQLRADILEEYRPVFNGGLKRLLDDGL